MLHKKTYKDKLYLRFTYVGGENVARVCITGFLGWGCAGDEAILQAIMDSLGGNEFVVCTSLPYTMLADYKAKLPVDVVEVRQIYDIRADYDAFILGGGGLSWGFGWRQALLAFCNYIPSMNYAVGYRLDELWEPRINGLYKSFLERFDAITVRDMSSKNIADALLEDQTKSKLTMCPSINLKEEKFDCPEGMIAVCPRYEDYGYKNKEQLDWLVSRLTDVEDEVMFIPFAPLNTEGVPVDLELCFELKRRLKHSRILNAGGFSPRRIKYAISRSKLVISGGRYHALVWASAHSVPFEVCPTSWHYPKVGEFERMYETFGSDKLKEMELENARIFKKILGGK